MWLQYKAIYPFISVKCDDDKGSTFQQGETLRFERQQKDHPLHDSLDVVMIVEEKQCNRDITDKLTNVVYEMDQSFMSAGA